MTNPAWAPDKGIFKFNPDCSNLINTNASEREELELVLEPSHVDCKNSNSNTFRWQEETRTWRTQGRDSV